MLYYSIVFAFRHQNLQFKDPESFGLKKSIKWLNKETVKVEEKQT